MNLAKCGIDILAGYFGLVKGGNLNISVKVKGDERILGSSNFAEAVLNQASEMLKNQNVILEQRVEERTKEVLTLQ